MKKRVDLYAWGLMIAITLIWGSSYILMKRALVVFDPMQLAALRLTIAFVVCLPLLPKAIKDIPRAKYLKVLLMGSVGIGLPIFFFAFAVKHISSSLSGIINSLSPLFAMLTGFLLWGVAAPRHKVMGILIGFCGALILVFGGHGFDLSGDAGFVLLPVLATLCYGLNANYVKENFQSDNSLSLSILSVAFIGVPAIVIMFVSGVPSAMHAPGALPAIGYIALLGGFGTVLAYILYYRLIQHSGPLFAASVTYLIPIVAIGWGLWDGESLALYHFAGLALILAGVYFVSLNIDSKK
jgi:drug/metabolite transporter (DMT)-like permease